MEIVQPHFAPLQELPQLLRRQNLPNFVVITDSTVGRLYRNRLPEDTRWLEFPAGEQHKTLGTACGLLERLSQLDDVDRSTAIVAVGGGVVGDIAGFVAATYLRGIPLVQVPTTVVAMVDSSIGGKVGVDLPTGKNLVGAFHPARQILVDPEVLCTLPRQEWCAGMAEVIKHALLDSHDHLSWIEQISREQTPPAPERWPSGQIRALLSRSQQVKLRIVKEDPLEQGIRAYLNLGHTLGHALETVTRYRLLSHGEAVSIGLIAALEMSGQPALKERVRHLLERWNLPTRIPAHLEWEATQAALRKDKKAMRLVILHDVGKPDLIPLDLERLRNVFEKQKGARESAQERQNPCKD